LYLPPSTDGNSFSVNSIDAVRSVMSGLDFVAVRTAIIAITTAATTKTTPPPISQNLVERPLAAGGGAVPGAGCQPGGYCALGSPG
jgi:hypothetical protein